MNLYLDIENFNVHILKKGIDNWNIYTRKDFQREFKLVIEGKLLNPSHYEYITNDEFETQDELDIYLSRVYGYIFEDGPWPERDEDLTEA